MGNLSTPAEVFGNYRGRYTRKRRQSLSFRFYALYDKMYREDILAHAYAQCRSNRGAPGVDGQDFARTSRSTGWSGGWVNWRNRSERRRIDRKRSNVSTFPSLNGRQRPLGISTHPRPRLHDGGDAGVWSRSSRPISPAEQYAYRPGRRAQEAVNEVEELLHRGYTDVVDADLSDYFGSIPHACRLMKSWRAES